MQKIMYAIVVLIVFTCACKKDTIIAPIDFHYDYFPLKKGVWVVYNIDSVIWDNSTKLHTYTYQIKQIVDTSFIDNAGKETWRIERYKRSNTSAKWIIADVWYTNNTGTNIEQVEEDNRIIKLAFPIALATKWNANALNNLGSQEYKYDKLHTPLNLNTYTFDSTVTVIQKPYSTNLINTSYAFETYAKGVGLISKQSLYLYKSLVDTIAYSNYTYTVDSFGH